MRDEARSEYTPGSKQKTVSEFIQCARCMKQGANAHLTNKNRQVLIFILTRNDNQLNTNRPFVVIDRIVDAKHPLTPTCDGSSALA